MKQDDWKFASALAATLLLLALMVYSMRAREAGRARPSGIAYDRARIGEAAEKGIVNFHEASWWEEAGESP